MKLILSHFNDCSKLKEGEVCLCCRQFLQLIAEHVLYLCPTFRQLEEQKLELNTKCPVPLCDVMKQITILKKKQIKINSIFCTEVLKKKLICKKNQHSFSKSLMENCEKKTDEELSLFYIVNNFFVTLLLGIIQMIFH